LQRKKMRDIVLQIHRMHKLYNKVRLQAFWAKPAKNLALDMCLT